LIPLSRVANIRSVHTLASVHPHRLGRMGWTTPALFSHRHCEQVINCEVIFLTHPPSYPPWLHGRYPLHRYYGDSDSCLAPSCTKAGILDYKTRTSRHPVSNHPMRPVPGYASCSRSAWPPIRFLGYRRFFGLRASVAVSSVAYRPYRVCVTVIQDRSVYRLPVHFQLLSTPPRGDAVTFSFLAGSSAREGLAPSCARLFSSARPQPSGCINVLSLGAFDNLRRVSLSRTPLVFEHRERCGYQRRSGAEAA
jgi:hypothetical protein